MGGVRGEAMLGNAAIVVRIATPDSELTVRRL